MENFNSRAIVINSPVNILTDWMIQYIHFDRRFSSMLAIIFLSEFVSTIFKIKRAFWVSSKILISGYFSKSFNAIVIIEKFDSLFPTFLFYPHTHTHTRDVLSLTLCTAPALWAPGPLKHQNPNTQLLACAFWTLDFLVGFHVFLLGNFMEAHLSQEQNVKWK